MCLVQLLFSTLPNHPRKKTMFKKETTSLFVSNAFKTPTGNHRDLHHRPAPGYFVNHIVSTGDWIQNPNGFPSRLSSSLHEAPPLHLLTGHMQTTFHKPQISTPPIVAHMKPTSALSATFTCPNPTSTATSSPTSTPSMRFLKEPSAPSPQIPPI